MQQESRLTLERKIHFYRTEPITDLDGSPEEFDARAALRQIGELSFEEGDRYLNVEDGQAIACWPEQGSGPPRLRLGTVRRSALPQIERVGRLRQLRVPAGSGLLEAVHVVFFPRGIVGVDFNFYGPRLSRLAEYFARKGMGGHVEFAPLLRQDVAEQLEDLRDIRMLRLRARVGLAPAMSRASRSLSDAFEAAQRVGQVDDVELVIRSRPRSRRSLGDRVFNGVKRLARTPQVREEASKFIVRGLSEESGRVQEIDVLRDHFIAVRRIVRLNVRSRALDPTSAFEEIIAAHQELRSELEAASSIGIE